MAFITKQPNGLYMRFSGVSSCPTDYNMTRKMYIAICKDKAAIEAIDTLDNHLKPFEDVIESFNTACMEQEQFDKIIKEAGIRDIEWRLKMEHRESQEQQALFEWAAWNEKKYPGLDSMFAIPNGGKRSKAAGGIMKAEGMKKGVPDLFLPIVIVEYDEHFQPSKLWAGLFIEMKFGKGVTSKEQKEYHKKLIKNGYSVEVCYNCQEAINVIVEYIDRKKYKSGV